MEEAGGAIVEKNNFARKLGSADKKTREKGLSLLVLWLSCQQDVGEDELKKIWKGLFYSLWHSDKAHVQGDLINKLAGILESLDADTSLAFFEVFLSTMRREWNGIDRLRLDKFYRLLRQFLVRVFTLLQKSKWNEETISKYMNALVERSLLATDQHPALGVNLHFVDIFLVELRKFQPLSAGTLRLMLQPCYSSLAGAADKTLLKRIKENVFVPLLEEGRTFVNSMQAGSGVDEKSFGAHVVSLPLGARLFELASSEATPQANRKILYEIHAEFAKLDKLVAAAGIDLSTIEIGGGSNSDIEMAEVRAIGPTRQSARQARKRATMDAVDVVDVVETEITVPKKKKMKQILDVQTPNDNPVGSPEVNVVESRVSDIPSVKTKKFTKSSAAKQVKSKHDLVSVSDLEKSRGGTGAQKADCEKGDQPGIGVTDRRMKGKKNALIETAEVPTIVNKSKSKKQGSQGLGEGKGSSVLAVETEGTAEIPKLSLAVPHGAQMQPGGAKSPAGDLPAIGRDADSMMTVSVDDSVISNLEEKFASIAAVTDQGAHRSNGCSPGEASPTDPSSGKKKRKRGMKTAGAVVEATDPSSSGSFPPTPLAKSNGVADPTTSGSTSTKKKKVKFMLKNNIVWKPNNPLPPQSMRTPPSATPRGSALKKGVPAGPIRVTPARKVGSLGSKRRSPSTTQILSITKQKPTARSPKSLSKGGPRFARRVRKSPGSPL